MGFLYLISNDLPPSKNELAVFYSLYFSSESKPWFSRSPVQHQKNQMIAVGRNAGGGPQSEGEESEGEGEEGEGEGDYTVYECPGLASVTIMRLFFKQGLFNEL
jgi:hypothetical protein